MKFQSGEKTIGVLMTTWRNFDQDIGQLEFRQRSGAILIKGEYNWDFDEGWAQLRSEASRTVVSTMRPARHLLY